MTVLYDKRGDGVATITLNRPDVLNAYNVQMRDDLFSTLSAITDDDDIRAVILRGNGRAFCAGADLTEFGTAPSPTAARRIRFGRDVWALLHRLAVPVIAALHGYAFGSGLEMALLCDFRIAAEGTMFALPEVQLGMIPAAGGTQTLAPVVGLSAALDLLLTGRRIETTEALQLGLVTRVVRAEFLDAEVEKIADTLVRLSPAVVRATRQAVKESRGLTLEHGLALESRLAAMVNRHQTR
ncbi:MAG: enoyl-CoA hydratase [Chloroflexota bacterium]